MQTIVQELLQNQSDPSVSVVLPTTYHAFGDKQKVRITIKNGIHTIEKQLPKKYSASIAKLICQTLHRLADQIDFNHPPQSVALFVNQKYAKCIPLPFPVTPKAVISDTFEIQDLLYNLDKSIAYYVVHLSKKHTRLFKGMGPMLQEIEMTIFHKPLKIHTKRHVLLAMLCTPTTPHK